MVLKGMIPQNSRPLFQIGSIMNLGPTLQSTLTINIPVDLPVMHVESYFVQPNLIGMILCTKCRTLNILSNADCFSVLGQGFETALTVTL
jgi:hypothetical protein